MVPAPSPPPALPRPPPQRGPDEPPRRTLAGLAAGALLTPGLAAAQAVWHLALIRNRSREGCFRAFRLNHWLGFTVFAGIALDLAGRG